MVNAPPLHGTFGRLSLPILCSILVGAGAWCAPVAQADWQDDIGYIKLLNSLGPNMPTGNGVFISQVEAGVGGDTNRYFPDATSFGFDAANDPLGESPVFVNGSVAAHPFPTASNHATNVVAIPFYGDRLSSNPLFSNHGIAWGANTIVIIETNDYLQNVLNCGSPSSCSTTAPDAPLFTDPADNLQKQFVVQNHSWVGTLGNTTGDQRVLRKVDYLVDQYDLTTVVGVNNGDDDPLTPSIPPHPPLDNLLAHSFNAISVGKSNGLHSIGPTASFYGPGRAKPLLVAPLGTSSANTATVSGVATLLHDALGGTDGTKSEPVRAILLAGATKHQFTAYVDPATGLVDPWGRTASQPLDNIFGAGQVNVFNSYLITQGGQFVGSASDTAPTPIDSFGWDYNNVALGTKRYYEIVIPEGTFARSLSVALTWNVKVDPSFASQTLANLSLTLRDSTGILDESNSSDDNLEHLYVGPGQAVEFLAPGTYTLEVASSSPLTDFGLAWRTGTLFGTDPNNLTPSADFDEDGIVGGSDFLAWQRNFGRLLGATHTMGDADGDGDVDADDRLIFLSQYNVVLGAAAAALAAVPEPSSLLLGFGALGAYLLARKRRVG